MLEVYRTLVPWKEQIRAGHLAYESAAALEPRLKTVTRIAVDDFTRATVASSEALSREFGQSFDSLNQTLEWGFELVADNIESLRADFSYWMSLAVAQLQTQNETLNKVLARLDAVHETLRTPAQTRAQELFREAYRFLGQELLVEAVDYLLRGIAEYDVDFVAQYHLGTLYLYGLDDDDDVIDLPKAEHHLGLSARYARPVVSQIEDAVRYQGEALFHASVACYAMAGELRREGADEAAEQKLQQAVVAASESIKAYDRLSEAHYHLAKYHALLGNQEEMKPRLREAIVRDHRYLLKASLDRDFDDARQVVAELTEEMRLEVKEDVSEVISQLVLWRAELSDVLTSGVWDENSAKSLTHELDQTILDMRLIASNGTYLDYRQSLDIFATMWWSKGTEEVLRKALGKELSDHVITVTQQVQDLVPHLDQIKFRKRVKLWTSLLIEQEASRLAKLQRLLKDLTSAPENDKREISDVLSKLDTAVRREFQERANPETRQSAQDRLVLAGEVLSGNNLVANKIDSWQLSLDRYARQRRQTLKEERGLLKAREAGVRQEITNFANKKELGKNAFVSGILTIFPGVFIAWPLWTIAEAIAGHSAESVVGYLWFAIIGVLVLSGLLWPWGLVKHRRSQQKLRSMNILIQTNEMSEKSLESRLGKFERRCIAINEQLRK